MGPLRRSLLILAVCALGAAATPIPSWAGCDIIPGVTGIHRGALGELNRSIVGPGEFIAIDVNRDNCDQRSAGIDPDPLAHVITLVFTPPQGGPRSALVIAPDCNAVTSCDSVPTECVDAVEGQNVLVRLDQGTGRNRLFFRVPDTLAETGSLLAGPGRIIASRANAELLCDDLEAASSCAAYLGGVPQSELVACVDLFYEKNGSCETTDALVDSLFPGLTVLPPPNRFLGGGELLFTTDVQGNLYLPWDFSGILLRTADGSPTARVARGMTSLMSLVIPGDDFLTSLSPQGFVLPPIFTPVRSDTDGVSLFGTIDTDRVVTRVARFSPNDMQCQAGTMAGQACTEDDQCDGSSCVPCPGGTCDPAGLFDFTDDYPGGVGPIPIPESEFTLSVEAAVPLEGLIETDDLFAFVLDEQLDGDQNGDADDDDIVVTLARREDAAVQNIGESGAPGRAVAGSRIAQKVTSLGTAPPPFRFPAVSVEDDFVAFLEAEAAQGQADDNGDGDVADYSVRAFQIGRPDDLLAGFDTVATNSTAIEGRPLGVSQGVLYYLTEEMAGATTTVTRMSKVGDTGSPNNRSGDPVITPDRRYVAFSSVATNLGSCATGIPHIYVHDRDLDGDGVFDEVGQTGTVCVSVDANGVPGDSDSRLPTISDDGRYIAFVSFAGNLDPAVPDTNFENDVYVHDRDADDDGIYDETGAGERRTFRVSLTYGFSVPTEGTEPALECGCPNGNCGSQQAQITPDGRFVAFDTTRAFDPADDNIDCSTAGVLYQTDVYVHDRDADKDGIYDEVAFGARATQRVSVLTGGTQTAEGIASNLGPIGDPLDNFTDHGPALSPDGRFVTYATGGQLDPRDTDAFIDGYLTDRDPDGNGSFEPATFTTVLVSRSNTAVGLRCQAVLGVAGECGSIPTAVTPNGDVLFFTLDTQIDSDVLDTNGFLSADLYTWDRETERISTENASAGRLSGLWVPVVFPNAFPFGQANPLVQISGSAIGAIDPTATYTTFFSTHDNLVDLDGPEPDYYVHNRVTKDLVQIFAPVLGTFPEPFTAAQYTPSLDARAAATFDPVDLNDTNGEPDVFVVETLAANPQNLSRDLNADGDLLDNALQVFDLNNVTTPVTLPQASRVSVHRGAAAYLRIEAGSGGDSGADLNGTDGLGDGDTEDLVAQLYAGRDGGSLAPAPENLCIAASEIDLSDSIVAALFSEPDEGPLGTDRNGDLDTEDQALVVRARTGAEDCAWQDAGTAGEMLAVRGPFAAVLTHEADQGDGDLTGDGGDVEDRVLRLWDANVDALVPIVDDAGREQPTEDFVFGEEFIALRTPEIALCNALPESSCGAPGGCDCDLNGDGDCCDAVLQTFELPTNSSPGSLVNSASTVVPCPLQACKPEVPYRVSGESVRFLLREEDEGPVGVGRDRNDDGDATDLLVALLNIRSGIVQILGEVEETDPSLTNVRVSLGDSANPLDDPPFSKENEDVQAFLSKGLCLEDSGQGCTLSGDCLAGELCFDGTCQRTGGTCASNADCVSTTIGDPLEVCEQSLATVTGVVDSDGDEVPDPFDNCPKVFNPLQTDIDGDGVGDLVDGQTPGCDVAICGNGVIEADEGCDDGNLDGGDSCSRFCRVTGCFGDLNGDGRRDAEDVPTFSECFGCGNGSCTPLCLLADSDFDGDVDNTDSFAFSAAQGTACEPAAISSGQPPFSQSFCGLLGGEPLIVVAALRLLRRRRNWQGVVNS